ncbi:MAG: LysR family transcriptional regulator [Actinomycetota bacterium]
MDVRQLEAFLAVVDHGSFSAAATALFTVQSNISSHVGRLEDEVGAPLLDRRSRQLTPAGIAVERRGREVLRQISGIEDDLASLEERIIGEIECGTTPSVGLWILPTALAETTRAWPEVTVTIVEAQSDALMQQVLVGRLDMAITTNTRSADAAVEPLFDEDIVAVFADEHPLATAEAVSLAQLAEQTLLLPLPDNPLYRHIAQAFDQVRLPLRAPIEVGSSALVAAMAGKGLGVALVPATATHDSTEFGGRRVPIADLAPREVALTTRAGHPPSAAAGVVADIIVETARAAASTMPGCRVRSDRNANGF